MRLCKDCIHYFQAANLGDPAVTYEDTCKRHSQEPDPVNGGDIIYKTTSCYRERRPGWWSAWFKIDRCGPEAKFYEEK